MEKLLLLGLFGLIAQLIDGSLGMAYGVTSTTLLLTAGLAPAMASATVHLAEVGTTLASGVSHWKFGNVDWRVVGLLGAPGAVGAFLGAVVLSSLSAEAAAPWVAAILFGLGVYILARFSGRNFPGKRGPRPRKTQLPAWFLSPLGSFAGFLDAVGGGGWGPVGTPALLSSGRIEPRKVIGSVDTSEFLVALAASAGFLFSLTFAGVNATWLAALLGGGLLAAPLAAWLVRRLPPRVLGNAVGGVILVTNAKTFGEAMGVEGSVLGVAYVVLVATWLTALTFAIVSVRRDARPATA